MICKVYKNEWYLIPIGEVTRFESFTKSFSYGLQMQTQIEFSDAFSKYRISLLKHFIRLL